MVPMGWVVVVLRFGLAMLPSASRRSAAVVVLMDA